MRIFLPHIASFDTDLTREGKNISQSHHFLPSLPYTEQTFFRHGSISPSLTRHPGAAPARGHKWKSLNLECIYEEKFFGGMDIHIEFECQVLQLTCFCHGSIQQNYNKMPVWQKKSLSTCSKFRSTVLSFSVSIPKIDTFITWQIRWQNSKWKNNETELAWHAQ